jgi:hypothetical protein
VGPSEKRALLETLLANAQTDQARLKALELLDRLDERERQQPPPQPPRTSFADWYAEDPERLAKLLDLSVQLFASLPEWQAAVEQRAEEIVEQRAQAARAAFVAVDAETAPEEPEAEPEDEVPAEAAEAVSEPREAEEDTSVIPPEILARQWPSNRPPSSLRDIPTSRAFQDDN